jgi:hypothetical protein
MRVIQYHASRASIFLTAVATNHVAPVHPMQDTRGRMDWVAAAPAGGVGGSGGGLQRSSSSGVRAVHAPKQAAPKHAANAIQPRRCVTLTLTLTLTLA